MYDYYSADDDVSKSDAQARNLLAIKEQVKKLAEETAQATGETTKLIEKTVEAVEKGIVIADATAENMDEVMVGAKTSTEKMAQMAEELHEEANNMYIIDEHVAKVAEIVDNNSATSQETAAVSEEQTAQVESMVGLMERFHI